MSTKLIKIESHLGLKAQVFSAVKNLDHQFFPTPWTADSWSGLFSEEGRHSLMVAIDQDSVIGFSLFDISRADSFAHLLKIIVDPDQRIKGVGKDILSESVNELKKLGINNFFLEVEENNLAAIALYTWVGFKVIHYKKHFYSNGKNAFAMTLCV